ncbi:integrase domain-containing protein [Vibrio sp. McD22-P3]|uniref:integrase domain-containing protein n=1 Tax=Vibrio sp. McD22-P3 TaxID=2724880 RepID=UPI001F203A93|nr:integrase domain-containing protein [Vibrio sp. McD22-P3]MCF4175677.1 integrase domain-containing protein [Vibrio sp. McD22-P3]
MSKRNEIRSRHRFERANPNARNFGLRARCMLKAAEHAMEERRLASACGFSSRHQQVKRFAFFVHYMQERYQIKDMRRVRREHVEGYAKHLRTVANSTQKSASWAQNYLSAVNTILSQARGDSECRVTGTQAQLSEREFQYGVAKGSSDEEFQSLQRLLGGREFSIASLQRAFGLRFEEAAKLNAHRALREAQRNEYISITAGTKGGKPRRVDVFCDSQCRALEYATKYQGDHKAMIPKNSSYKKYRSFYYRQIGKIGYRTHTQRREFARTLYELFFARQGLSVIAPIDNHYDRKQQVRIIANELYCAYQDTFSLYRDVCLRSVHDFLTEASELNFQALSYISKQLGHERASISKVYVY